MTDTADTITDRISDADSNPATSEHQQQITAARNSFSGKTLTESQFREAWAISSILNQEIHKTGSFRDKLTDYAHAFSRSEKFDALRGEAILRDIHTARYTQSMNQVREALKEREDNLTDDMRAHALRSAESIASLIRDGETQPFYKAYDTAAVKLADQLMITQARAKSLMTESYQAANDRDLYETGKELEEAYHKPVREAEIAARKAEKLEARTSTQSQSRSMSR